MPARRGCKCRSNKQKKEESSERVQTSPLQTFDRIEWLKKRVDKAKLIDRTVRLKYLIHPGEMSEHQAIKKVFNRFDEDGNKLLEALEVKQKFDEHRLAVKEEAITKIFKSAATNRKRNDPCKELSLYEFCVFSKSEKANRDFKGLMNRIKDDIKKTLYRRRTSTIAVTKPLSLAKKILPVRKTRYIQNLPSSFNPLMNHFKDEEKRNELRDQITNVLEDIDGLTRDQKLEDALSKNTGLLKELIKSHFPQENMDEESRRLFTQNALSKNASESLREKIREALVSSRRRFAIVGRHGIKSQEELQQEAMEESVRTRTTEEVQKLIRNARKSGKSEAQQILRRMRSLQFAGLPRVNSFAERTLGLASPTKAATFHKQQESSRIKATDRTTKQLLSERLVLRRNFTESVLGDHSSFHESMDRVMNAKFTDRTGNSGKRAVDSMGKTTSRLFPAESTRTFDHGAHPKSSLGFYRLPSCSPFIAQPVKP